MSRFFRGAVTVDFYRAGTERHEARSLVLAVWTEIRPEDGVWTASTDRWGI